MKKEVPLIKNLVIPDTHTPYHDRRAVDLVLKVAKIWRPDCVTIQGDFWDCESVSSHLKGPNSHRHLDQEAEDTNALLDRFDALKPKKKIYVMGNHEDRLSRYLLARAPEVYNLISVEKILRLKERGWIVVPYGKSIQWGYMNFTHDDDNAGPNAVRSALSSFQTNISIGHIHRMLVEYQGNAQGKTHVGASYGWLGDASKIEYLKRVKVMRNWQLGFGLNYMDTRGVVYITPVPIIDYRCMVEGKLYLG